MWNVFYIVGFTHSRLFDNPEEGIKYLEKTKKIGSDIRVDKINLEAELSYAYYRLKKFHEAKVSILNALQYIRDQKEEFFNNYIRCLTQKCLILFDMDRAESAKELIKISEIKEYIYD